MCRKVDGDSRSFTSLGWRKRPPAFQHHLVLVASIGTDEITRVTRNTNAPAHQPQKMPPQLHSCGSPTLDPSGDPSRDWTTRRSSSLSRHRKVENHECALCCSHTGAPRRNPPKQWGVELPQSLSKWQFVRRSLQSRRWRSNMKAGFG